MPSRRQQAVQAVRDVPVGGRFSLGVAGTSMEPVLRDGDQGVAVRTAGSEGCRLGDLVVVGRDDAGLVVHRLLWASRSGVRTWGDGRRLADARIPADQLLGRLVEARRDGRCVMQGPLARRMAWGRAMSAAAFHWTARRLKALAGLARPSRMMGAAR